MEISVSLGWIYSPSWKSWSQSLELKYIYTFTAWIYHPKIWHFFCLNSIEKENQIFSRSNGANRKSRKSRQKVVPTAYAVDIYHWHRHRVASLWFYRDQKVKFKRQLVFSQEVSRLTANFRPTLYDCFNPNFSIHFPKRYKRGVFELGPLRHPERCGLKCRLLTRYN